MNFNSIKLRLQIWYGLILLAVIATLGVTAFQLESGKLYRQIDSELAKRITILAGALNGPPGGAPLFPSNHGPPSPDNFHLIPRDEALFGGDEKNGYYFIITGNDREEIARSTNAPVAKAAGGAAVSDPLRTHEIITPTGEQILVGRHIVLDLAELHLTAIKLAAFGTVILLFGLAGGWFLVSRALRPIGDISTAAEKISTGDLTQRINVAETKSELGRLAAVLNGMFTRLEAAFVQQRRFSADAAHELRTPVSVLIAQTHAAMTRRRSYEENLQTIEACHRAAQRMRRLIASLLQLARLDAGQENLQLAEFDVSMVADECAELIQPLADEGKVKLVLETSPAKIRGDADQIGQIIINLLTNAIQYNHPGGEVRLQVKPGKARVEILVSDTGAGITTADLPHIFDRFYRADQSRASGNAGLGLAISKAIILAHGGTIEVASQEGSGATFLIQLPSA